MVLHENREERETLSDLLKQKILIFRNFCALGESLGELIEKEDMTGINVLLRQRQAHMDRIDRVDARIRTLGNGGTNDPSPNTKKKVSSLLKELEEMITKAIRMDESCAELAVCRIEDLRTGFIHLNAGKQGLKGYRGKTQSEPRFLDVKS